MKSKNAWFMNAMFALFILLILSWGFGLAGSWALVVGLCLLVFPAMGVVAYSVIIGLAAFGGKDEDNYSG